MVNDFERGLAMMRKHDPQVQEDGFGMVKQVATEHVADLIAAYRPIGAMTWPICSRNVSEWSRVLLTMTTKSAARRMLAVLGKPVM
ncbi:hypothetical protein ABN034_30085 [Actinopolymorpha sp. B11F2]|uniref:hypothetical protein n=1 Tax=Actinopolymorpha sp. B11F2 TaxID=3160862 RepID=UPI0032E3C6E7